MTMAGWLAGWMDAQKHSIKTYRVSCRWLCPDQSRLRSIHHCLSWAWPWGCGHEAWCPLQSARTTLCLLGRFDMKTTIRNWIADIDDSGVYRKRRKRCYNRSYNSNIPPSYIPERNAELNSSTWTDTASWCGAYRWQVNPSSTPMFGIFSASNLLLHAPSKPRNGFLLRRSGLWYLSLIDQWKDERVSPAAVP